MRSQFSPVEADERFVMYDVPWKVYVALNDSRADRSASVRMYYSDGTLELLRPGGNTEAQNCMLRRILEFFAMERDVFLEGLGSATIRSRKSSLAADPDQSYHLRSSAKGPPDLVFDISLSASFINKPSLYAGLGVRELWTWRDERLIVQRLRGSRRTLRRSDLFPELDLAMFERLARMRSQTDAVKAYRQHLLARP